MHNLIATALLLVLSTATAFAARALGLPLPFLIGPLCISALVATASPHRLPSGYRFPPPLRLAFVTIIGVAIGLQIRPELFANTRALALSAAALTVFVVLAHGVGYAVLRGLGRYDRSTAFYAAAPGGLFEAIAMGEEAGADPTRVTLQQFLRIIVVVTLLPIGLSLWYGAPVGSSAGMSLGASRVTLAGIGLAVAAGLTGIGLAHLLRFPAKQLTGPMAVAGVIALSGIYEPTLPQWLIDTAQVVVGTALGMRFKGLSVGLVMRSIWLTLLSVSGMLVLSAGFAALLTDSLHQPFDVLLISFAPGGVTEMSLVALSLASNPAFVTLHHVYRIVLTVVILALTARLFRRTGS
ncbi:MAG: AbrB family transcriptional regulator [Pseudomonadota bacterium]